MQFAVSLVTNELAVIEIQLKLGGGGGGGGGGNCLIKKKGVVRLRHDKRRGLCNVMKFQTETSCRNSTSTQGY